MAKKKLSSQTAKRSSRPAAPARSQLRTKTQQAVAKARRLAKAAAKLQQSSDAMHRNVEDLHRRAEATHQGIREVKGKSRAAVSRSVSKTKTRVSFPVVGIGASAGGFEALTELLKNLRPDIGMAFVFVQHLDPNYESKLTSLLASATEMETVEIRDRTPLAPNRVFIIPSNHSLILSGGMLRLRPRRKASENFPIDQFLQSLAREQGNGAIGILLSGNGHDGTTGMREIKSEGGITFAQDDRSAKFPAMPQSARQAGCVDFVLSPAEIAQELERIAEHANALSSRDSSPLPGTGEQLAQVFAMLRHTTGVDFSSYKLTTLQRRITRRFLLKKIDTLGNYLRHLQQNPAEVESLFHDILINVTGFFRDPSAFTALRKKILPKIIKQKPAGSPVRIWVPGCATGEEVYSLAICIHEFLGKNLTNKIIQIFGTDISENMVGKARFGVYPKSIESQVSPDRLRRYFQKHDNGYQIAKFVRDVCVFARQNVAEDPPFSKLDLISCRNLLIYLGLNLQKKVFPIFHYSLRPGGYLMLGTSETIGSFSDLFTIVDKRNKIYVRNETYARPEMEFLPSAQLPADDRQSKSKAETIAFNLQKRADEILLTQFSPPGVIVNARLDVLHFRGKTGPYLEPAPGTASLNLLKMVRDELVVDLRTGLAQAAKTNSVVRKEGIPLREHDRMREVTIEVIPFKHLPLPERFFLVLFRDANGSPLPSKASRGNSAKQQAQGEVSRLRKELAETKESLQTIIEEQEATNEELKSANEEIQSSNEELQSTNEELETAKEELQSTNEELTTLNEELQNRNTELSQANNDLNNLIGSFNMPILILGNDLTIRRFTPLAQKIFNLIPSDEGRRISDINPNIALPNLNNLVTEVIDSLHVREVEVQDREGHWYSLRIRPYRTSENKIEGAVLVLVDIGEVRQGLEEVSEVVPLPMLLLSPDLHVKKANESFYDVFKVARTDTEGQAIYNLGNGQWNIPDLRTLLDSLLPKNHKVKNFRVEHDFPNIGRRTFLLNARRLYPQSRGTDYVLVLMRDVTGIA